MLEYLQTLIPIYAQNTRKRQYFCKLILFWPFTIFQNDLFFLNFLISPKNRNLEPLTNQYDLGHPAYTGFKEIDEIDEKEYYCKTCHLKFSADQLQQFLRVLPDTLVDIKPPGGDRFVRHDLGEASRQPLSVHHTQVKQYINYTRGWGGVVNLIILNRVKL